MIMLRPNKKAKAIADKALKGRSVKVEKASGVKKKKLEGPYLQH